VPTTATALIVIDVQEGFGREDFWGQPANLDVESSIAALVEHWRTRRPGPLVIVRHDSANPASPLHPGDPGNRLRPFLAAIQPDLLITKKVNSAFYGEPDLDGRLRAAEINDLVICGVQTNMCVETTARMAGNLGYRVQVPLDATSTFGLADTVPGFGDRKFSGSDLMVATALNLQRGSFAKVTSTAAILSAEDR
jgi:nicotinamidase-related amidase